MKNKRFIPLLGFCILLPVTMAYAAERDPFQPATWANNKDSKSDAKDEKTFLRPLEANPLRAYVVVGIVVSDSKAIAVIKSPDGKDHFVNVGDAIGSEGGHIEAISSEGITVNTANSRVTIPVSNKIEMKKNDEDN